MGEGERIGGRETWGDWGRKGLGAANVEAATSPELIRSPPLT